MIQGMAKYITSIIVFSLVGKALGATEEVVLIGYCILSAGWIAHSEK